VLELLEGLYGPPPEPHITDPWEQVLLENVVYLAGDERRLEAFQRLHARVGTAPSDLLRCGVEELSVATSLGIRAVAQAHKLHAAAALATSDFGSDLTSRLGPMSLAEARRALRRFPSIGEPAADRILLLAGLHAVPALDSNGVRVLVRLGLARDAPSYAATQRAAVAVLRGELPAERASLLRAYQLLMAHGRGLCRRSAPECTACPLSDRCAHVSCGRSPSP
jgi:endonuclease III